jgi:hypothetical protein
MAPKLRKVEPVAIGNPKLASGGSIHSLEMVGNLEVGLIGPQFNRDFRFGFLAAIDCTLNRLRWSCSFHPFHPERPQWP